MADFFIADMHFGSPYRSNAKPRGFASTDDMDETIRDAWRSRVSDSDVVWVLGDVGDVEKLRDLPGTKHLIFGNNDRPKTRFKDSGVFASHADQVVIDTDWKPIQLIHRPEDAVAELNVLHGHTHFDPDEPDPRFVSVSVDKTGWGPIALDEVIERFRERAEAG